MVSPSILSRPAALVAALAMALTLTACPAKKAPEKAPTATAGTGALTQISGAGATFPYPVYATWAAAYRKKAGVQLNYQSIGSGGGIKQIEAGTVDFGASDAPLQPAELEKAGLVQWPMIIGGVVPVVSLPGIGAGDLRLPPDVLAGIYLGVIKKWDDPRIKAANPRAALPDLAISVVHRADASGTTWIFTNYLQKVSPTWKTKVGFGKAVAWPVGVGGKGNEGVASFVARIKGSIGYVEYAYALQNKMTYVKLKNHDGQYVTPTAAAFQAAAANADWANAKDYYLVLTDQPGKDSWPISGASFILMHAKQREPWVARTVLDFIAWSFANGGEMAKKLDYVPLPQSVVKLVEATWAKKLVGPDGKPFYTVPAQPGGK